MNLSARESPGTAAASPAAGFGLFKGVYIPSTLTILGVIMYLRMGWVVSHVGLVATLLIICMSTIITFLTALSISATSTNMKVGTGGAYYMISRVLGVEAGAAIGIPLYLSQALGISFYIVGFSESISYLAPGVNHLWVSIGTLVALALLAWISADLALKIQTVVFLVIIASLVSFYTGPLDGPIDLVDKPLPDGSDEGFWAVFAVFFPAVTGILTGVSMSGDLKQPSRSIPVGTILAVVTGFIIYMSIPVLLSMRAPDYELRNDPLIMVRLAWFGPLIFLGLWGATLSSALGSLLGAPRTLVALARDGVMPAFLGRADAKDNPRIATLVSFVVALGGILAGDLNAIAPVLTMFFLTSYGMLNLSAGFEELISNPSWRPRFKIPWWVSMAGAFGCFATMFMINSGATFIALFLSLAVYYSLLRRNIKTHWGDMRRGILMFLARFSIYRLALLDPNPKSWRPNFIVLSGVPTSRWYLVELADAIAHGKGFLTVATILPRDEANLSRIARIEESISEYLKRQDVPALVEVSLAHDVMEGLKAMVQSYGMGPLVPNTVLLGESEVESNIPDYVDLVRYIYMHDRNLVLMRQSKGPRQRKPGPERRIDVWWGRERQNAGLMLALGFMLQTSPDWRGSRLVLKSIVRSEEEARAATTTLNHFLADGRLDVDLEVIVESDWQNTLQATIRKSSQSADLVFIGMRPPDPDESMEDYAAYYRRMLVMTEDYPPTLITIAAQKIDFAAIFT